MSRPDRPSAIYAQAWKRSERQRARVESFRESDRKRTSMSTDPAVIPLVPSMGRARTARDGHRTQGLHHPARNRCPGLHHRAPDRGPLPYNPRRAAEQDRGAPGAGARPKSSCSETSRPGRPMTSCRLSEDIARKIDDAIRRLVMSSGAPTTCLPRTASSSTAARRRCSPRRRSMKRPWPS
jgi:hypothetical protein